MNRDHLAKCMLEGSLIYAIVKCFVDLCFSCDSSFRGG